MNKKRFKQIKEMKDEFFSLNFMVYIYGSFSLSDCDRLDFLSDELWKLMSKRQFSLFIDFLRSEKDYWEGRNINDAFYDVQSDFEKKRRKRAVRIEYIKNINNLSKHKTKELTF